MKPSRTSGSWAHGAEDTWHGIASLIAGPLLSNLDSAGPQLFAPHPVPAPDGPISSCGGVIPVPRRLPHAQLVYVVSGEDLMMLGRHWFRVQEGRGFFIPQGMPYMGHLAVDGKMAACACLWFDIHPFGIMVHRCTAAPDAHHATCGYVLLDTRLPNLLQDCLVGVDDFRLDTSLTGKGLLLSFFGLTLRAPMVSDPVSPDAPGCREELPAALRRAVDILDHGYHRPFDLRTLAQSCYVSPFSLCRLFRRHLNTTPLGYLTGVRLKHAHRLLQGTELPVADVARLVGYSTNQTHFSRLFRRVYGTSPGGVDDLAAP